MRKLLYVLLLLLISCKVVSANNLERLKANQTITSVFNEAEINDLAKILDFFNKHIFGTQVLYGEDVVEQYQHFFERMQAENFRIGLPFQKQRELYSRIDIDTIIQIWLFYHYIETRTSEMVRRLDGKYLKFLAEFGKENEFFEGFEEVIRLAGDFSPTIFWSYLIEYKPDVEDIRTQLVVAIEGLMLNHNSNHWRILQEYENCR
jgi:hypothetical protein